jgi:hypothetical protein
VIRSLRVSVHAQARDRTQQLLGGDIGANLAGRYRRFQKCPKCGFQSLLEVRGQRVEGRVSGVEGLGESAFGRDEVHVTLHPSSQRIAWLVLGSQDRRSVCARIDFATEDGRDEVGALRKVPVNSRDADVSLLGDLSDRSIYSRGCEHRHGRLKQRIDVALGVGAYAPICVAPRLDPIIGAFRFITHHTLN